MRARGATIYSNTPVLAIERTSGGDWLLRDFDDEVRTVRMNIEAPDPRGCVDHVSLHYEERGLELYPRREDGIDRGVAHEEDRLSIG